ncbi:hypothetical protein GCM10010221_58820 [Streptomyces parvus]|nr:hypothetical protein GCM10010221_58820 [Streptomyces parvus]
MTGRSRRCPEPVRARAACGRTRPTKPIAPAALTRAAVSRAVVHSSTIRVRATFTPSAAAASCPKAKASSVRAWARQMTRQTARTAEHRATSLQPTPLSEPRSQNRTPRVCSASAEVITTNEVRAEKSCIAATPERTTRSVEPPRVWLSSSTRAKERSAPTNAPADSDTAPPPTPRTTTTTAPVEPPEETPRTKGSASGLRSRDCITVPHTASPAPHTAARRVRGMRRFQMMPSRIGLRSLAPKPRCAATVDQTSGTEIRAGPIVTATATEARRSSRPLLQSSTASGAPARAGRAATADGSAIFAAVRLPVLTPRARSRAARPRRAPVPRRSGWWGSWPGR